MKGCLHCQKKREAFASCMGRRKRRLIPLFFLLAALTSAVDVRGDVSENLSRDIRTLEALRASQSPAMSKLATCFKVRLANAKGDVSSYPLKMREARAQKSSEMFECELLVSEISDELRRFVVKAGGTVVSSSVRWKMMHVRLPLSALESVAERDDVLSVRRSAGCFRNKVNTSRGDTAHKAASARQTYGVTGQGVKIGVISDSVRHMSDIQDSGDLPPSVDVLDDGIGYGDDGEGTAMLEIVHDLAPGAGLAFCTSGNTESEMADNIARLAAAGCRVIVDDIGFFAEPAFSSGPIEVAASEFVQAGGVYATSAGNSYNADSTDNGVWEGDFTASPNDSTLHLFAVGNSRNKMKFQKRAWISLQWNDVWNGASDDYALYVYDADGNVVAYCDDTQSGLPGQNPQEMLHTSDLPSSCGGTFTGLFLAVRKAASANVRRIRLDTFGGTLAVEQGGSTYGHSCAEHVLSVGAATVPSGSASFSSATMPAIYSSDGPAWRFFDVGGEAIPGGRLLQKPDLLGAASVACATPGFETFAGTSAAAPHVAAIVGLMLEANSEMSPQDVFAVLTNSTFSTSGWSRSAGYGALNAEAAVSNALIHVVYDIGRLHVSANGNDANSGLSWVSAKRTIQAAIDAATDGVTIMVTNGVYAPIVSGGKQVAIRSVCGATSTVIDGSLGNGVRCADLSPSTNTVLSGFTLVNGRAENDKGGGAYCGTLNCCVLSNNVAGWGGAVHSSTLNSCLLVGNRASYGGGSNSSRLRNCTVVDNVATEKGGGAVIGGCDTKNCIIWGNEAPADVNICGSPVSFTYSSGDPLFVDAANGDYRLSSDSPCINAGANAYVYTDVDLAGNVRVYDGNVDQGAYEFAPVLSVPSVPSGVNAADGASTASVLVSWNAVDGATSYTVWRCASDDVAQAVRIATVSDTSYSDAQPAHYAVNYYWVKAVNDAGSSGFSASDSGYRYQANTHLLKYDANGGTGTMADQIRSASYASYLTKNAYTRSGYAFMGWATTPSGSRKYRNGEYTRVSSTVGAVVRLYAVWSPCDADGFVIENHVVKGWAPVHGTDIVIPDGVTSIADYAFEGASVTSVTFPDSLTALGTSAFNNCAALTDITFGTGLQTVGSSAFCSCVSLEGTFVVPEGVTEILSATFTDTGLSALVFPATLCSLDEQIGLFTDIADIWFKGNAPTTPTIRSAAYPGESSPFYYMSDDLEFHVAAGTTGWQDSTTALPELWPANYTQHPIDNYTGEPPAGTCTHIRGAVSTSEFPYKLVNGNAVITNYTGTSGDVVFPATIDGHPVTEIAANAFYYGTYPFVNVTISEGIQKIGHAAFGYSSKLETFSIPSTVTVFGDGEGFEFVVCPKLQRVDVAEGNPNYKSVDGVLYNKSGTTLIYCPASKSPGETFVVPSTVTQVAKYAFGSSKFKSVTLPASLAKIEDNVFWSASGLETMDIPASVTSIGRWAFCYCSSLTSIKLPAHLTSIGQYSFVQTKLKHLDIPSEVTAIGEGALNSCSTITNLTLRGRVATTYASNKWGSNIANSKIWVKQADLEYWEACFGKGLNVLDPGGDDPGVPEIGTSVDNDLLTFTTGGSADWFGQTEISYDGTDSVRSGSIGHSQTSWMKTTVTGPGTISFWWYADCEGGNWDYLSFSIDGMQMDKIGGTACRWTQMSYYLQEEGTHELTWTYRKDGSVTKGVDAGFVDQVAWFSDDDPGQLPDGVYTRTVDGVAWTFRVSGGQASVGGGASGQTAVPSATTGSISIPTSLGGIPVTAIADYAFYNCTGIASVTILTNVTSIGNLAFEGCYRLESVTIPNSVTSIGDWAFEGCYRLESVTIPSCVTSMRTTFPSSYSSVTDVVLAEGAEQVAPSLFSGCCWLESVTIPNSVTSIGDWAFEGCCWLESVTIPNSVTSIGDWAFEGCHSLESVTIPSCVTSMRTTFPSSYSVVTDVVLAEGTEQVAPSLFSGCRWLESVTIPNSVTSIGDWAFNACVYLESVTIPASVTHIGMGAFSSCLGMISIVVDPDNPCFTSEGGLLYDKGRNTLIAGSCGLREMSLPETVTSIGECAIFNNVSMTSFLIPNGVTDVGQYAFYACAALDSVVIPRTVKNIGTNAFDCCSLPLSVYVDSGDESRIESLLMASGLNRTNVQVRVYVPIPALDQPDAEDIRAVMERAADAALAEKITTAAQYESFRAWAGSVCGSGGLAIGSPGVMTSEHAWLSFALGCDTLIQETPGEGDVRVLSFGQTAEPGKFQFLISVEGVSVGSTALKENLKQVFGIEGGTSPMAMSANGVEITFDTPEDGKVKFTAGPNDASQKSFFMRVKMNL